MGDDTRNEKDLRRWVWTAAVVAAVTLPVYISSYSGCSQREIGPDNQRTAAVALAADSGAGDGPAANQCTCYIGYHNECGPGEQCVGTGGVCIRAEPKGGWAHGGCTKLRPDKKGQLWVCDGICKSKKAGTACGTENANVVGQSLDLWRQAMNMPALAGGGMIDPPLAQQARDLPLTPDCSETVARNALGIMALCRGESFVIHPPYDHTAERHVIESLLGDRCRIDAGNLCMDAVITGLTDPAAALALLDQIPIACPMGPPFAVPCDSEDPLECVRNLIETHFTVLRTPLVPDPVPGP